MGRPQTQADLLTAAEVSFQKILRLLDTMDSALLNAPFNFADRDQCVRDVLVHLYEWHKLLLQWAETNLSGGSATFLPEGYNWKTYPAMNVEIRDRHAQTSLATARQLWEDTHRQVLALLETLDDEQLFTKKYFPWTGSTSLGSYCVSATSSHYAWALKKLTQHVKTAG